SCGKAIRRAPKHTKAHGALGQALLSQGHFLDAQQALRRCQQLLPPGHPLQRLTAQLLQQCQQGLDLQPVLEAVLQGQPAPADPVAQARLASLAQLPAQQRFATAASLYAAALAQQPSLARAPRYTAACAAALAGCGQGKDAGMLDAGGRLRWRRQALTWLRAELAERARQLRSNSPELAAQARRSLEHWRRDSDLARVRD